MKVDNLDAFRDRVVPPANSSVDGSGPTVGQERGGGVHDDSGDGGGVTFEGGNEGAGGGAEDRDGGAGANQKALSVVRERRSARNVVLASHNHDDETLRFK